MAVALVDETREAVPEAPPAPAVTTEDLRAAYDRLRLISETGVIPAGPVPQLTSKVVVKRVMPDREILSAMTGLGTLLAVRVMLSAAVGGAFWLALMAMERPTLMAISVLAAYAFTTVVPLTYLSTKRT